MTRDEIQARIAHLEQLEAELDASLLETRQLIETQLIKPTYDGINRAQTLWRQRKH